MNNAQLLIILFTGLFIFGVVWWSFCKVENFSDKFLKANSPDQFFKYLDLGDHKTMAFMQRGSSGNTVLLLHNNPFNFNVWLPLYQTMQKLSLSGYKTPNLVAYDLRGHGTAWVPVDKKYSDGNIANQAWTIDQFVTDCNRVYNSVIGSGKVTIVGFGFGGLIAQKFALKYSQKIEKLILLQTAIDAMPGLNKEIEYLSGPSGLIQSNPNIYYLTMGEKFVQQTLCEWFYIPYGRGCKKDPLVSEEHDTWDDTKLPQYTMAAKMWRQGSASSTLQVDKLLVSAQMDQAWANAGKKDFTVRILAATEDPLGPPDYMVRTFTAIRDSNRAMEIILDIVDGRHGFTVTNPEYIAGIICDECPQLSAKIVADKHE